MSTNPTSKPDASGASTCYPSLWESLIMADGNAVEAHPQDAEELAKLYERGIIRGTKWIRLTDHGKKLRDAVPWDNADVLARGDDATTTNPKPQ